MAETLLSKTLETPFGSYPIERYGAAPNPTLQAFNSADRLLLEMAHDRGLSKDARESKEPQNQIVTVNDAFGALSIPAGASVAWTDSAVGRDAIIHNARVADVPCPSLISSTDRLAMSSTTPCCVLMQIPKQLAYFEYQLQTLAAVGPPGLELFAAGMDKHLPPGTGDVIAKHFGPTERHRGKHKARVFSAKLDKPGAAIKHPGATPALQSYRCEPLGQDLAAGPNVFSRQKLDHGSALLIQALGQLPTAQSVLDLGCGNGVLGLYLALEGGATRVEFCDESAQAIESARHNAAALLPENVSANFHWSNGLSDYAGPLVDRIVCNPPFHSGHVVDAGVGRQLLARCSERLNPGGELLLVANRHLDYRAVLKLQFGAIKVIASDRRFVVTQCCAGHDGRA